MIISNNKYYKLSIDSLDGGWVGWGGDGGGGGGGGGGKGGGLSGTVSTRVCGNQPWHYTMDTLRVVCQVMEQSIENNNGPLSNTDNRTKRKPNMLCDRKLKNCRDITNTIQLCMVDDKQVDFLCGVSGFSLRWSDFQSAFFLK